MEQRHREQAHAHEMFERVERFPASGLSQTAFCRQEGLRYNPFRYWLKKYQLQEALSTSALATPADFIPSTLRQEHALPILQESKSWLGANSIAVLPKSAISKAVGYMLGQWSKLEAYTRDSRLEIDNNLVENAIRPVALGRKSYLFAGSHEGAKRAAGAQRAAIIYSLVATAKRHEVEPFAYLKDVLTRIHDHPHHKLAELLPQNWVSPAAWQKLSILQFRYGFTEGILWL